MISFCLTSAVASRILGVEVIEMETIQVQVSSELAQRLRQRDTDLSRILEWGLRFLEHAEDEPDIQQQIVDTLRQVGAIGPDVAMLKQYLEDQEVWKPIQAAGQPASTMIVAERAEAWNW